MLERFRPSLDHVGQQDVYKRQGHEAASGQALNPQMGAGSDVVSRLAAARNQEGRERLGHLVIRFLQRVVSDAVSYTHLR